MVAIDAIDIASVLLRFIVGITMFAHGYRHIWGGGKLPVPPAGSSPSASALERCTPCWASVTELGAAVLLWLGLLTPLGAAGVLGTMSSPSSPPPKGTASSSRPGEGYEYVLNLLLRALALGALGGGRLSLDNAFDVNLYGWGGFFLTLGAGGGGALLLLATSWRRTGCQRSRADYSMP